MDEKHSMTFRLSEKARAILRDLADERGVTKTAIIEMLLRREAKREERRREKKG